MLPEEVVGVTPHGFVLATGKLMQISFTMENSSDALAPLLAGFLDPAAFAAAFDPFFQPREVSRSYAVQCQPGRLVPGSHEDGSSGSLVEFVSDAAPHLER